MRRHAKAIVGLVLLISLALGVSSAQAVPPSVSIEPVTGVTYTSAQVKGTFDPEGQFAYYSFEYTQNPANGWSGFAYDGAFEDNATHAVTKELTGLKPGTEYHVRLAANNFIDPEVFSAEPSPTFTTDALALPGVTIDPPSSITSDTAHFSGTINPNAPAGNPAASDVSWHFECTPACPEVPGNQTISADATNHEVEANASDLDPNTSYEVRLVATNAGGQQTASDEVTFSTGTTAPLVRTLLPAVITDSSAWIGGEVNPRGSGTTYYVEYSSNPGFVASTKAPASEDKSAGFGNFFVHANHHAEGLAPNTTYYYRIVATGAGTTVGEATSFTTLAAAPPAHGLPDARVWEKVSPAEKGGADIFPGSRSGSYGPISSWAQAAVGGDAVTYASTGKFGGEGSPPYSQYLARRGSASWSTEGISPRIEPVPSSTDNYSRYVWFSPDLSAGILEANAALNPGDAELVRRSLYFRDNNTGAYRTVSNGGASTPSSNLFVFQGASTNGTHIAFMNFSLLEASTFYERAPGGVVRPLLGPAGSSSSSSDNPHAQMSGFNAISADGSRIFAHEMTFSGSEGNLYVIENGGSPTLITGSERAGDDPTVPAASDAVFLGASEDGSVVFFKSSRSLTDANGSGCSCYHLYRWDAEAPAGQRLTDLTTTDPQFTNVRGSTAISDDGKSLYFVSAGDLTGTGNRAAALYLWRQGEGIRPVARTAGPNLWNSEIGFPDVGPDAQYREARVTPDGRFLAFTATESLTAYNTNGTNQLYLYDSNTSRITCISCGTVEPKSKQGSWFMSCIREIEGLCNSVEYLANNLRPNGSRIIFDSKEALVPEDSNGLTDVYEWQEGKLHLISSGTSGAPSRLLDASEDGNDVFFTTTQRLVPSDSDDLADLYDARVDGLVEPTATPPCVADECQGTPSPPPAFQTPSSSSFAGAGNAAVIKPRCAKGKVRLKGRCVGRKAKKHDKKSKRANSNRRAGR